MHFFSSLYLKLFYLFCLLYLIVSCTKDSHLKNQIFSIPDVQEYFDSISITPHSGSLLDGSYLASLHGSEPLTSIVPYAAHLLIPISPIISEENQVFSAYHTFKTAYPHESASFSVLVPFLSKKLPVARANAINLHPRLITKAKVYHYNNTGTLKIAKPDTYVVTYGKLNLPASQKPICQFSNNDNPLLPTKATETKIISLNPLQTSTKTYCFDKDPEHPGTFYYSGYQKIINGESYKTEKHITIRSSGSIHEKITVQSNYRNNVLSDFPEETFGKKPYGKNGTQQMTIFEEITNESTYDSGSNKDKLLISRLFFQNQTATIYEEQEVNEYYIPSLQILKSKLIDAWTYDTKIKDQKYHYSRKLTTYLYNKPRGLLGVPSKTTYYTFLNGVATLESTKLYEYYDLGYPKSVKLYDKNNNLIETTEYTYDSSQRLLQLETTTEKPHQCKQKTDQIKHAYNNDASNQLSITTEISTCNKNTFVLHSKKIVVYNNDFQPIKITIFDVSNPNNPIAKEEHQILYSYKKVKIQEKIISLLSQNVTEIINYSYDNHQFLTSTISTIPNHGLKQGYDQVIYEYK